jgi:hypothetical protein
MKNPLFMMPGLRLWPTRRLFTYLAQYEANKPLLSRGLQ